MHDREEIIMDVLRAGVRGFVLKSDTEKHLIAALDALSIHRSYFSGAISDTLWTSSSKASRMPREAASRIASAKSFSRSPKGASTRKSRSG